MHEICAAYVVAYCRTREASRILAIPLTTEAESKSAHIDALMDKASGAVNRLIGLAGQIGKMSESVAGWRNCILPELPDCETASRLASTYAVSLAMSQLVSS